MKKRLALLILVLMCALLAQPALAETELFPYMDGNISQMIDEFDLMESDIVGIGGDDAQGYQYSSYQVGLDFATQMNGDVYSVDITAGAGGYTLMNVHLGMT